MDALGLPDFSADQRKETFDAINRDEFGWLEKSSFDLVLRSLYL
jgi:hypothetical protein